MYNDGSPSGDSQNSELADPAGKTRGTFITAEECTAMIQEARERERELEQRTASLEALVRNLTLSLGHLTQPHTSTSIRPPYSTDSLPPHAPRVGAVCQEPLVSTFSPPTLDFGNQSYANVSLREALEIVPKFDGHNIPVLQFARACKRAKELTPFANEAHLVRLLRSKLTGHAYLAVEDEEHTSIDKLVDSLKRTFGPSRNSNYYRGQLSINFKKPTEHSTISAELRTCKTPLSRQNRANLAGR